MSDNEYKYFAFDLAINSLEEFCCGFGSRRIIISKRTNLQFILK